jgi:hypothetical protein
MAQIETTIRIEMEVAKQSWWDMVATPGMRRRTALAACMGLFTQWSGNTLISLVQSSIPSSTANTKQILSGQDPCDDWLHGHSKYNRPPWILCSPVLKACLIPLI